MKRVLLLIAILSVAAFGAAQKVEVSAKSPSTAKAGKQFKITINVAIPSGYHIYGPVAGGTGIATTVVVTAPKGYKTKVVYPKTKAYNALGETVQVWDADTSFTVLVSSPKGAKGVQKFKIKVGTQACNDRSCLPPDSKELTVSTKF